MATDGFMDRVMKMFFMSVVLFPMLISCDRRGDPLYSKTFMTRWGETTYEYYDGYIVCYQPIGLTLDTLIYMDGNYYQLLKNSFSTAQSREDIYRTQGRTTHEDGKMLRLTLQDTCFWFEGFGLCYQEFKTVDKERGIHRASLSFEVIEHCKSGFENPMIPFEVVYYDSLYHVINVE